MSFANSNYKGKYKAPCYNVSYNGSATIPCVRSSYPQNSCQSSGVDWHGKDTYNQTRIHQALLGAGGGWSIGCVTVQGRSRYGIDEMKAFSKLVGNEATLIVKR